LGKSKPLGFRAAPHQVWPFLWLPACAAAILNFFNAVIVEAAAHGKKRVEHLTQGRFLRTLAIILWAALECHIHHIISNKMRPRDEVE